MRDAFLRGFLFCWLFFAIGTAFMAVRDNQRLGAESKKSDVAIALMMAVGSLVPGIVGGSVGAAFWAMRQEKEHHADAKLSKLAVLSLLLSIILPYVGLPLSLFSLWWLSRSKVPLRGRAHIWFGLVVIGMYACVLLLIGILFSITPNPG